MEDAMMSRLCFRFDFSGLSPFVRNRDLSQKQVARLDFSLEIHGMCEWGRAEAPADKAFVRLESFDAGGDPGNVHHRTGKFRFFGRLPLNIRSSQFARIPNPSATRGSQTASAVTWYYSSFPMIRFRRVHVRLTGITDAAVPAAARKSFEQANEAMQRSDQAGLSEAIGHLEKAVKPLSKVFCSATWSLALHAWMLNSLKGQKQPCEKHPKWTKRLPTLILHWGALRMAERDTLKQKRFLLEDLKLNEKSWQGHFSLGHVYWDMGDWVKPGHTSAERFS